MKDPASTTTSTGSASWLVMTVLGEMFGLKGTYGDLLLAPRLVREQFDERGEAQVKAALLGRRVELVYRNPARLDYPDYRLAAFRVNGKACEHKRISERAVVIPKDVLGSLLKEEANKVDVDLEA